MVKFEIFKFSAKAINSCSLECILFCHILRIHTYKTKKKLGFRPSTPQSKISRFRMYLPLSLIFLIIFDLELGNECYIHTKCKQSGLVLIMFLVENNMIITTSV